MITWAQARMIAESEQGEYRAPLFIMILEVWTQSLYGKIRSFFPQEQLIPKQWLGISIAILQEQAIFPRIVHKDFE
jgi:hypothetical protein